MAIGRNDPCLCGSGRKYKKCCLAKDEAARLVVVEPARSPLHDLDERFVDRVGRAEASPHICERFGDEADPDDVETTLPDVAEGGSELLVSWSVYHNARENESMLSRREREWIEAQRRSWMSVWEVRECVAGRSMLLADLLTGERRLVQEARVSRSVVARDAILGRVVSLGAESILGGAHRRTLSPIDAANVVQQVRRHLRAKLPLPAERLRGEAITRYLIGIWNIFAEEREELRAQSRQRLCPHCKEKRREKEIPVAETKDQYYAAWPDMPVPFLGNKTPRQAACSRSRERVALLLKSLENREAREPAASRFDVNVLRRELGIEE